MSETENQVPQSENEIAATESENCETCEMAQTPPPEMTPIISNDVAPIEPAPTRNEAEWVTPHFKWHEFTHSNTAVARKLDNTPNAEQRANIKRVAETLEIVRDYICKQRGENVGIQITSGFRSERVNAAVGGSRTSAHKHGLAADIRVKGYTSLQLARVIREMKTKGLIKYDQLILEYPERGAGAWVHIGLSKGVLRQSELTISSRGTFQGFVA